jgi:hypothetical protein
MNNDVTAFINAAPEEQKQIMETLRNLIHESVTGVEEEFKWSRPVFKKGKDFAYLKTAKNYVTLGFFHFQNLNDPDGLLEGTGKDMRHIKIKKAADIDQRMLKEWVAASVKQ